MVSIEAPQLKPVTRKTLLDTANVITDAPAYTLMQALKYEPRIMGGTNRPVPTGKDEKKTFEKRTAENVTPKLFQAYRGLDESLLNGVGAAGPELEALFTAGEPLFVEERVQELLLNPAAVDITPTPGTALTDAKAVLGLLEQWMATRFLYQPTLSGNLLAVNLIQPGVPTITETPHGAPIASAAGYGAVGPDGLEAGPGEAWLYISGQINIWTGSPAKAVSASNLERNRDLTLVEKSYAASIDGPVAAILIGY